MALLDQLPAHARDLLVRAMARGEYQLLLGAGGSAGATGGDGESLPGGEGLRQQIVAQFGLSDEDEDTLTAAYDAACRIGDVYTYLRKRFTDCEPADWHRQVVRLPWRRVWTLNIDDVIEQAYKRFHRDARQDVVSYAWHEPFQEDLALQVVHLHGHVQAAAPTPLVFGLLEYLDSVESTHGWQTLFGESWPTTPFIVVGARLRDEFDLARVLRARPKVGALPSIYVSRTISNSMRQNLLDYGLHPVAGSAEAFFQELNDVVSPHLREQDKAWKGGSSKSAQLIFAQQFRQLHANDQVLRARTEELYQGYPPVWDDILEDRDVVFTWSEDLAARAKELLVPHEARQSVVLEYAPRFSGKTATILRVARSLQDLALDTFLFRGEQRLDVDATYEYLAHNPDAVLLFDGIADFSDDVQKLLERSRAGRVSCIIVAVEYRRRSAIVDASVEPRYLGQEPVQQAPIGAMDDVNARRAVSVLRAAGRLGFLETIEHGPERAFKRHGLFDAMAIANLGVGFGTRAAELLLGVDRLTQRKLALLATMTHETGYAVPFGLAVRVTKLSQHRMAALLGQSTNLSDATPGEEALAAFLELQGDYVVPRFGHVMLDPLLRSIPPADVVALLIEYFRRMSPFTNKDTQRNRTYAARTVGAMMRANSLTRWVGREALEQIYVGIKPQYDWNGRYWEQRAIASLHVAQAKDRGWSRASSFAETAVRLNDDGHRNNTLGNILLQRAAHELALSNDSLWVIYGRAIEALTRSRQSQPRNSVPFLTFFQAAPKLAERLERADAFSDDCPLALDWPVWYADAKASGAFTTNALMSRLRSFEAAWSASPPAHQ